VVSSFAGLDIDNFAVSRDDPQMAPVGIQTNIEQIVSPEAVSENGPGADLYTYVERTEPKVISQHSSPANAGSRNATGQTFPSPEDGSNSTAMSQISQARRVTVDQSQSGSGGFVQVNTISDVSSFPLGNPPPSSQLPGQHSLQGRFNHNLGTSNSHHLRPTEMMQLHMTGNSPQMQLYAPSMNPQTISSEQTDAFRPMMDGFDTMNGMMGMNMDLNNEDDDFWWARSWGSVRIL
jgi:hypothetical protein